MACLLHVEWITVASLLDIERVTMACLLDIKWIIIASLLDTVDYHG